ncbi:MAG: ParB/RepB/Spo0J family partition protein [Burkholderiales bacterium]
MIKPKGLGRGLDALLGADQPSPAAKDALAKLRVDQLQPGRYQPRTRMDEESLRELAASIQAQGMIQPILVRGVGAARYEIIAGERRWRAAQLAGLAEVPVVIREVPDQAALAMALIENIQREDLNPMEEAKGVQRLIDEFGLTHQQASEAIGRSRSATTNLLRMLNLTRQVQEFVFTAKLDMGHARALLSLDGATQVRLAEHIVEKGLSVRETEALVNQTLHPKVAAQKPAAKIDRDVARLQEDLSEKLGTTVELKHGKSGGGKMVIEYTSLDHLDDLMQRFNR